MSHYQRLLAAIPVTLILLSSRPVHNPPVHPDAVIPEPKHFAVHGIPEAGSLRVRGKKQP